MISFDYLHPARSELAERIADLRVPAAMHNALLALCAAGTLCVGSWGIQADRLRVAIRLQGAYERRYKNSQEALQRSNIYYRQVEELATLDARVHAIAASGDHDAQRLAQIAQSMPRHAWLTAISRDGSGISLDGSARDLLAVSQVLLGLAHAHGLRNAILVKMSAETGVPKADLVDYTIHVEDAAP